MTISPFPKCRSCGAELKLTLVDLGLSPLANSYVPLTKAGMVQTWHAIPDCQRSHHERPT